jgi:hypothetical protein
MVIYRILLFIGVCLPVATSPAAAQRSVIWKEKPGTWSMKVGVGASRYLGDLNERFNLSHLQLGVAMNATATYRLTDQLALWSDLQIYYIRGTHEGTYLADNNLSFYSLNPALSLGGQYDFWKSENKNHTVVPYAIAGAGLTYITPRTTYKGTTYSLAPLHTEGITYTRLPLLMRYGIGLPLFSTERFRGTIEGIYTHVLTDYLDDVSGFYTNRSSMDPLAAALADRSAEVGAPYHPAGAKRGNHGKNDGYMTLSAQLIFIISTPGQRNYRQMFSR